MLPHLDAIISSHSPLLQHLLTSRWPALHLSHFDFYRPQRSWGKVIFSEVCVKNSVHKGGGMCGRGGMHGGGMHGRGHVWWGHAWQGAYMVGGMCGRGGMHATHAPPGHHEIWSVNVQAVCILLECILVLLVYVQALMGLKPMIECLVQCKL